MKYKFILNTVCLISALNYTVPAISQEVLSTPAFLVRINQENLWLNNTNNVAGGMIDAPFKTGNAEIRFKNEKGNFKPVQIGDNNSTVSFHAEGGGIYNELKGIYLWGSLTYNREQINGAKYNASLIDPLRDMPFIVADSAASKWINQDYSLKMRVSTPKLFSCVYAGVELSYQAGQGAKQIDPRPLVKLSKIEIKPSLLFNIDENNLIGVNFDYYNRKEDGSASNLNSFSTPHVWEMVAPGYFSQGESGSFGSIRPLRSYNAEALGGGLQYGWQDKQLKVIMSCDYLFKVEDALCSYTKPQMAGTVKTSFGDVKLTGSYSIKNDKLFFRYIHSDKCIDGIEYQQTYDNTFEVQSWITNAKFICSNYSKIEDKVALDYMITNGNSYKWKFGTDGSILRNDYIYYLPKSTENVKTMDVNGYISRNFKLNKNSELLCTVKAGYNKNLKNDIDYNGYNPKDVCYKDFTLMDYNYSISNYRKIGGEVYYTFSGLTHGNSSLYVVASFNYLSPTSDLFSKRTDLGVKMGLAF